MRHTISRTDKTQIRKLSMEGYSPKDISEKIGAAYSTVNKYKSLFKAKGVEMPDLRGRNVAKHLTSAVTTISKTVKTVSDTLKVIVNGVSLDIEDGAKSVHINKDKVEIAY